MQIIVLCPHIFHDNQRCDVGEVIDVSEASAASMVARGEAKYYAEEADFAVLGKQPLIADEEDETTETKPKKAKKK